MSAIVGPKTGGLLEAEPAQLAMKVFLFTVQKFVLLQGGFAEETWITKIRIIKQDYQKGWIGSKGVKYTVGSRE